MKQSVTCHDIEGQESEVEVDQLTFRPAAYGVIIQNEQILLSKQWNGYDFPGGGIELGETIKQALIREVKEETGVDVKPGKLLLASDSFFKLPFYGNFVHSIHLYYECQIIGGELSTEFFAPDEKKYADHPEWLPVDQLSTIKLYNSVDINKLLGAL